MYEVGNAIGYWGCVAYIIIMFASAVFVMKRYLKED